MELQQCLPKPSRTWWARRGKRLFDVLAASVALVLLAPALLGAALVIKLTSRGAVLFTQVRIGQQGRPFRPLKLRTMIAGRTPDPNEIIGAAHPEVTAAGRILRRLKIDELPQLVNVLAGQMSLVGPRPTLPEQVACYDEFQRLRLLVRPGLTGLAQVHGNTAIEWNERVRYDVHYVEHCSLRLDLWILWRTILIVVLGEQRFARRYEERFASTRSS